MDTSKFAQDPFRSTRKRACAECGVGPIDSGEPCPKCGAPDEQTTYVNTTPGFVPVEMTPDEEIEKAEDGLPN